MKPEDKVGLAGLACLGGVAGYLWAGLLTAAEIVAVSNPVGAVIGAGVFMAVGIEAANNGSGE